MTFSETEALCLVVLNQIMQKLSISSEGALSQKEEDRFHALKSVSNSRKYMHLYY